MSWGVFKLAWAKNGTPDTLGSAGDTMTISDLTAKKFNVFMQHSLPSGAKLSELRYDNDSGTNYAYREQVNGGADATVTSHNEIRIDHTGGSEDDFGIGYWVNLDSEEKLLMSWTISRNASGAGTAPTRGETAGKYNDGSSNPQITRIDIVNNGVGDFATNSNLSALGTD